MAEGGKITKSVLKISSGEFDLQSIHTLTLKSKGITDLGCLSECIALEKLDLSYNDISKLHKLAGLTALKFLNLSANRLTSVDGLQSLNNLFSLNIAGNLIGSADSLRCLNGLEQLKELRLRDDAQNLTNPVCMHPSYTDDVMHILSPLRILDGQRVRGRGSNIFTMCQAMDKGLKEFKDDKEISLPLVRVNPKLPESLRLFKDAGMHSPNKAEQQLRELLTSCEYLSNKAKEKLEEFNVQHHTAQDLT